MSFEHRLDSIIIACLLFSDFSTYIFCLVSMTLSLIFLFATRGYFRRNDGIGVQDMTVSEPKMTIFKPFFPTTTQMATSVIQTRNDFKTNSLLSLYKIMIKIVIFNLFLEFSTWFQRFLCVYYLSYLV